MATLRDKNGKFRKLNKRERIQQQVKRDRPSVRPHIHHDENEEVRRIRISREDNKALVALITHHYDLAPPELIESIRKNLK